MENQYEQLQQTLSDYRKLMKETEDKIQGVMEDLAKDRLVRTIRVEDIRDVLERLGTTGDRIWIAYGKLYGKEAPETVARAEEELGDQLKKLRAQAAVIERFLSLKTKDQKAAPPLLSEQDALVKDPGQDITKHRYFMSAMDVTCKRQSEFGINMPLLIRSFDPELIGALWEGKITEDHTGTREQYPEVFSALMPKSLPETAGSTEQTTETETETAQMPSAKKKRGKKSVGKTEPEGQLSLHLEEETRAQVSTESKVAMTQAQAQETKLQDEPVQMNADGQIKKEELACETENDAERELQDRKDMLERECDKMSDYTIMEIQKELSEMRELLKDLTEAVPPVKEDAYQTFTTKISNVGNPSRIKLGGKVILSVLNGNLRVYQAAFRQMGSITERLASFVTGETPDRVHGAIQRLYNTGIILRTTWEDNHHILYNVATDKQSGIRTGWGDSSLQDLGYREDTYPYIQKISLNGVRGTIKEASQAYACLIKCLFLEAFYDTYKIRAKATGVKDWEDSLICVMEMNGAFFIMHRHENRNYILIYVSGITAQVFQKFRHYMTLFGAKVKTPSFIMVCAATDEALAKAAAAAMKRTLRHLPLDMKYQAVALPPDNPEKAATLLMDSCTGAGHHETDAKETAIPEDAGTEGSGLQPEEEPIQPDPSGALQEKEQEELKETKSEDRSIPKTAKEPEKGHVQSVKTTNKTKPQSAAAMTSELLKSLMPQGTKGTQKLVSQDQSSGSLVSRVSEKQKPEKPVKQEKKQEKRQEKKSTQAAPTEQPQAETQKAETQKEVRIREEKTARFLKCCLSQNAYVLFPFLDAAGMAGSPLYRMASFATDEPSVPHTYSSVGITEAFEEGAEDTNSQLLYLASAMRVICGDSGQTDHGIRGIYDMARGYADSTASPAFNSLLYEMTEFRKQDAHGAWFFSDIAAGNTKREDAVKECSQEAGKYYNEYIENYVPTDKRNPRFMYMGQIMFAKNGDLAQILDLAKNDDRENVDLAAEEIREKFIKEGSPVAAGNIDHLKLSDYIDELWKQAATLMRTSLANSKLYGVYRSNISKKIEKIVDSVAAWINAVRIATGSTNSRSVEIYKQHTKAWTKLAQTAKKEILSNPDLASATVGAGTLVMVLDDCISCFNGRSQEAADRRKFFYINLLPSGVITLDENLLPDTTRRHRILDGFDLTERMTAFAAEKHQEGLDAYMTKIITSRQEDDHDYGSALQICDFLEECMGKQVAETRSEILSAKVSGGIEYALNSFREDLELAQGYGMLDNLDGRKEQILTDVEESYKTCSKSGNYGYFYRLVNAYRKQIVTDSKERKAAVEEMFRRVTKPDSGYEVSDKMKAQIEAMISRNNYTVAEDLIGRVQSGDIADALAESGMEKDFLDDFIRTFPTWYRMAHVKAQAETPELATAWIKEKNSQAGEEKIQTILGLMGFKTAFVKRVKGKQNDTYEVRLQTPKSRKKDAYQHPISVFGSEAEKTSFHVVCLYGKYTVGELKNTICADGLNKNTIVLMTHKFPMPERRIIAHRMHTEMQGKTVLVVDQPLMMYLATNCKTSVMMQALMQIAVPYASYQPYLPSSNADIRVEMFNGRKKELAEIESPVGANIIYGGRQLGKSAILKMAARELDHDENGDRAVLVDIRLNKVAEAARSVSRMLIANGILAEESETDNWDDLTYAIRMALTKDGAPEYLLLMMDEADAFIADCKNYEYAPIARLKALQEMPGNRFKFVIAGLRDVIRFTKGAAAGGNSVLPQLRSITVKPFEYNEAMSLIEEPLWYLGFRFSETTEPLVNTILANTNYFPGLIQLYCEKLVEALAKPDYAGYDRSVTPPYVLSERHIKKVLADEEFQKEVREKYFITLRHAQDNYYHILAYLMAYLYMSNGTDGYSPAELWKLACDLDIVKIANLDTGEVRALMEEMCELNVFRKAVGDAERYIFSRYNFYQMLGDSMEDIENKLMECMEEQ